MLSQCPLKGLCLETEQDTRDRWLNEGYDE